MSHSYLARSHKTAKQKKLKYRWKWTNKLSQEGYIYNVDANTKGEARAKIKRVIGCSPNKRLPPDITISQERERIHA